MKNKLINCKVQFFSLIIVLALSFLSFTPTNSLTVHIVNIEDFKGEMEIGIFNNGEGFPYEGAQLFKVREPVTGKTLTRVFTNLPDGDYAVAIFHDVNNDGICNKNFIGYPKEPFGFSNNKRPRFKAPSFNSTKFTLPQHKEILIKLR